MSTLWFILDIDTAIESKQNIIQMITFVRFRIDELGPLNIFSGNSRH